MSTRASRALVWPGDPELFEDMNRVRDSYSSMEELVAALALIEASVNSRNTNIVEEFDITESELYLVQSISSLFSDFS